MIPRVNIPRFFHKALRQPFYALRVGWKRLEAYRCFIRGSGPAPAPESVTLFLTHRCNLRCRMCGQWGESGVTKHVLPAELKEELTPEVMDDVIEQFKIFKPNVTLFGGEPRLYGKIIPLIRKLKAAGLHLLMITNGSLLSQYAPELAGSGIDEINLSLDGDEELHDRIREHPGLFRKIAEGVESIQRLKRESGKKKPLVNLQCTINQWNYRQLERLAAVAKALDADSLTFHHLIYLSEGVYRKQEEVFYDDFGCDSPGWKGFLFSPGIDPAVLIPKIREVKRRVRGIPVDFYPAFGDKEITEYYTNPDFRSRSYSAHCLSPWTCGYVFSDGSVKPCLNLPYVFGNIREERFLEIWNGEKAGNFRRRLKERKNYPACFRCTEFYRY